MYVFHIRTYIKSLIIYQPSIFDLPKYLINFSLINTHFIYFSKNTKKNIRLELMESIEDDSSTQKKTK